MGGRVMTKAPLPVTPFELVVIRALDVPGGRSEGDVCLVTKRPLGTVRRALTRLHRAGMVNYGMPDNGSAKFSLSLVSRDALAKVG